MDQVLFLKKKNHLLGCLKSKLFFKNINTFIIGFLIFNHPFNSSFELVKADGSSFGCFGN